jgi:hypothetical protein
VAYAAAFPNEKIDSKVLNSESENDKHDEHQVDPEMAEEEKEEL